MLVGSLRLDLLLGDVHSLKEKRSIVRPIVAELGRKFDVSAAETGDANLHRRAEIGVALAGGDAVQIRKVLQRCEQTVAGHPEVQLLSARTRVWPDDDE